MITLDTLGPIAAALDAWADARGLAPDSPERAARIAARAATLADLITLASEPDRPAPVELAPVQLLAPAPAGFQKEVALGTVAGELVIGLQSWCGLSSRTERHSVRVSLGGLELDVDAQATVTVVGVAAPGAGALPVATVMRLAEVAQSGALAELHALAGTWCAENATAGQRRAA